MKLIYKHVTKRKSSTNLRVTYSLKV